MNADDRSELNRKLGEGQHPSVVLDDMMSRWNGRWLMSDEEVHCRHCLAPQWPSNANDPMQHRPNCRNAPYLHPWLDLAELLRELPMVPL